MGKRKKSSKKTKGAGASGGGQPPQANHSSKAPQETPQPSPAVAEPDSPQPPAPPEPAVWPAWAYWLGLALACTYVAIQLAVPVTSTIYHPSTVRTDFSWDMFAVRRDCKPCNLTISAPGRPARRFKWGSIYNTPYQVARSRNISRLPLVAREACRREQARGNTKAQVFINCTCTYNQEPKVYDLDPFGGDYCSPEAVARFGP